MRCLDKFYQTVTHIWDDWDDGLSHQTEPGKRVYSRADQIPTVKNGLGMIILSTSQGILPDYEAREKKLGGEVLLKIF